MVSRCRSLAATHLCTSTPSNLNMIDCRVVGIAGWSGPSLSPYPAASTTDYSSVTQPSDAEATFLMYLNSVPLVAAGGGGTQSCRRFSISVCNDVFTEKKRGIHPTRVKVLITVSYSADWPNGLISASSIGCTGRGNRGSKG